jgi:hypothetical protein
VCFAGAGEVAVANDLGRIQVVDNSGRLRSAHGACTLLRGGSSARGLFLLILAALTLAGCGPSLQYNYVDAQNIAREREKPMFVFYRDHLDVKSTAMQEILEGPLQSELAPYVQCSLLSAYDPNRKFMAQYGVLAPPALVIVHPDSTYHSYTGEPSADAIRKFIADSQQPGRKPDVDITIPRGTDYLVRAKGTYDEGMELARRQNRNLVIVFKWWLDANSTEMLSRMSRPEVANRLTEAVTCVLDWDFVPNREHLGRFGVSKYPALVVVHPDGTYAAREGLLTVEEIVRFLSSTLAKTTSGTGRQGTRPAPSGPGPSAMASNLPTAGGDGWNWSPYYERAREQAQKQGVGMFIFYHSLLEDESARMARLLDTQTVMEMFSGQVHCSLSYAVPRNRQVMSTYEVKRSPAFVSVRPDGKYLVREGLVNIDDLRALQRFLVE